VVGSLFEEHDLAFGQKISGGLALASLYFIMINQLII
jgi:hypothetical protein